MNIAIILASGSGTRVQSQNIPKQFVEIANKPIFIHTIEKFLVNGNISKIVLTVNDGWIDFAKNAINKFLVKDKDKIDVILGGSSRNNSLKNGFKYLKSINTKDDDIIVTHDSVRMFISNKIIDNNIECCKKFNCIIDTCVKATDTIVESIDQLSINNIPNRDNYFYGQTPQTCSFYLLNKIYNNDSYDENVFNSCDLCKLAELNNLPIKITEGDYFNFKITTDFDLIIARKTLEENE